jgi:hypothetical protein
MNFWKSFPVRKWTKTNAKLCRNYCFVRCMNSSQHLQVSCVPLKLWPCVEQIYLILLGAILIHDRINIQKVDTKRCCIQTNEVTARVLSRSIAIFFINSSWYSVEHGRVHHLWPWHFGVIWWFFFLPTLKNYT